MERGSTQRSINSSMLYETNWCGLLILGEAAEKMIAAINLNSKNQDGSPVSSRDSMISES